jgi:hypothetical protein
MDGRDGINRWSPGPPPRGAAVLFFLSGWFNWALDLFSGENGPGRSGRATPAGPTASLPSSPPTPDPTDRMCPVQSSESASARVPKHTVVSVVSITTTTVIHIHTHILFLHAMQCPRQAPLRYMTVIFSSRLDVRRTSAAAAYPPAHLLARAATRRPPSPAWLLFYNMQRNIRQK